MGLGGLCDIIYRTGNDTPKKFELNIPLSHIKSQFEGVITMIEEGIDNVDIENRVIEPYR